MWRTKKFIIMATLVAVLLVAGIGGAVLAQTGTQTQPGVASQTLLDRVIKIYQQKTGVAIDRTKLDESFAQARREMQTEAMQQRLQNLVKDGKTTQQQADDYLKWWQAKPNVQIGPSMGPGFKQGSRGPGGMGGRFAPPAGTPPGATPAK